MLRIGEAQDKGSSMDLSWAKAMALHVTMALQQQAEKLEREGHAGSTLGRAFAREAGLDEAEAESMGRVATRMRAQVEPLDQRAQEIIQAARQQYPGGRLQPGEIPPAPPAELADLQNQRDAAVRQAVRDLERELGPAGLARLESHLKRTMLREGTSSMIVPSPSDIGPPGEPARPDSSRGEANK